MRVWFNHWFSTAYHLINMIKDGDPGKFTVVGSGKNRHAVYRRACDEWYAEAEEIAAPEYVKFCLDFCQTHNIDIFAPRRFLPEVAENAEKFEALGTKLLCDKKPRIISMLDDKQATYAFFREHIPKCVPEVRIARSKEDFERCYKELEPISSRVCYKLVVDEGAKSFRVIDNAVEGPGALLERPGSKISFETAVKVLSQYNFSIPVLLMPYLGGVEISVDCLATTTGNIIIPRYKTSKRYSEVIFSDEIMGLCDKIINLLGLEMPLNIQFKKEQNKLYLLEINPRMSGGLQLSCLAAGVNIPNIAVNRLLGIEKAWEPPKQRSVKVANIETPIICG